ncbi:juvenile hormone esterase-like [Penaeus japonicus]|uniref:juvenile hormone esterase-like n=1 Tax=Penaeus japonicus TaxID=27405 RepID=UPI001C70CB44|nr:juvenile hormone esterase-like [Penaeus japonicus]
MHAVAVLMVLAWAVVAGEERVAAPIVGTAGGEVSGLQEQSTKGKTFYSYYAIPFAQPPVGDLRFKAPVKAEPWAGVRNGTAQPPSCAQMLSTSFFRGLLEIGGEEDCLYLNVFTPKPNDERARLPVMVFIHGGAYFSGGAEEYPPHALLNHEVVLVVIQYRLGLLGFLSTEDDVAPGNQGLRDQVLALRWVQDNIHHFGGDSLQVTLFGESAGAGSIHLLMLSPYVLGLFHRVILQSGSALCPWSLGGAHLEVAQYIAGVFNCSTDQGSEEIIRCLQGIDTERLVSTHSHLFMWYIFPLLLGPRVDGSFLPHDPEKLLKESRHKKIDIITGVTKDEGALLTLPLFGNEALRSSLRFNFEEAAPVALEFCEGDISPLNQTLLIFDRYLGGINFNVEDAENVKNMFGDRHFSICHDLTSILHDRNSARLKKKVFRYELNHRGKRSIGDFFSLDFSKEWVSHEDDLFYLFEGGPMFAPLEDEDDLRVRDIMTTLWTNFATKGDPTPDDSLGFKWEPMTDGKLNHLAITLTPTMENDTREEARDFWFSLPMKQNLILHPEKVKNLQTVPNEVPAEEPQKEEDKVVPASPEEGDAPEATPKEESTHETTEEQDGAESDATSETSEEESAEQKSGEEASQEDQIEAPDTSQNSKDEL